LPSASSASVKVYVITDLDQAQIRPDEIADILRGHWHIENRLHWVRDVTYAEGHSQIRTGHAPRTRPFLDLSPTGPDPLLVADDLSLEQADR